MIHSMINKGFLYWEQWIKRRTSAGNPQKIHSQNIYILPSGFGWAYSVLVLSLLTGSINYQISAIYFMTFLLTVIGLMSAWETHANLKELSVKLISVEDTEQEGSAQVILLIHSYQKIRYSLEFQINHQLMIRIEEVPCQGLQVTLPLKTVSRGCFKMPSIKISSFFPFGIFHCWGYLLFNESYYVYPKPINPGFWPSPAYQNTNKNLAIIEQEELDDLKQVDNPWVEPNRIAWKIAAKGQGWYLKTRGRADNGYWLFRLEDLKTGDLETRLSHLSYWLHAAEKNNYLYGLELEHSTICFGQGKEHLKKLLRQLALY